MSHGVEIHQRHTFLSKHFPLMTTVCAGRLIPTKTDNVSLGVVGGGKKIQMVREKYTALLQNLTPCQCSSTTQNLDSPIIEHLL